MKKELAKKDILGGKIELAPVHKDYKEPDYSPRAIKKVLKETGLAAVEKVVVTNPVTKQKSTVLIQRDGTPDSKLIIALADPKLKRDQKDAVLSAYMWERGKENTSMMVDLFRYKGQHTKETRAFTSQVRFDFEMFIAWQAEMLRARAKIVFDSIGLLKGKNIDEFCKEYLLEIKAGRNFMEFLCKQTERLLRTSGETIAVNLAINDWLEAEKLEARVKKMTEFRERQQGFGIYLDEDGKPYSIFEDGEEVIDVVKRDLERLNKLNEEEK